MTSFFVMHERPILDIVLEFRILAAAEICTRYTATCRHADYSKDLHAILFLSLEYWLQRRVARIIRYEQCVTSKMKIPLRFMADTFWCYKV